MKLEKQSWKLGSSVLRLGSSMLVLFSVTQISNVPCVSAQHAHQISSTWAHSGLCMLTSYASIMQGTRNAIETGHLLVAANEHTHGLLMLCQPAGDAGFLTNTRLYDTLLFLEELFRCKHSAWILTDSEGYEAFNQRDRLHSASFLLAGKLEARTLHPCITRHQ